jgi:glycosyltransferase involved in cell wall biosynthesis
MNVGIYTKYTHGDEAYLAARLVAFVQQNGASPAVYSSTPPARLGFSFDRQVADKSTQKYTDWLVGKHVVIWTHVPPIEQLICARKRGLMTVIAPMWQELRPPFRRTLKAADYLVAFSLEARDLYKAIFKFKNVVLVPFDSGIPPFRKNSVSEKETKIFLPWFDANARCSQSEFLTEIKNLLVNFSQVYLTVAISSSRFSPAACKFFRGLAKQTGRLSLVRNVKPAHRPALYMRNDLTIFPAECDNYGLCSLTSIACGTPVVSFGVAPQTDFIYPSSNGVLVKTKIDYDENGVPFARPNYSKYFIAVQELLSDTKYLENMQSRITYNMSARKKSFELGWYALAGLDIPTAAQK